MKLRITLKAARMNMSLTQKEAAKRLGVTVNTLRNWENGKSYPDAMRIRRIEETYDVHYDDLIFLPKKTLKA